MDLRCDKKIRKMEDYITCALVDAARLLWTGPRGFWTDEGNRKDGLFGSRPKTHPDMKRFGWVSGKVGGDPKTEPVQQ